MDVDNLKPSPRINLKAGIFCFLGAFFVALISLIKQDGYGTSDLIPFLVWTLLFSFGVSILAKRIPAGSSILTTSVYILLALAFGFLIPFLWVFLVAIFLGPYIMAFSFPILPAWIVGGISGFVVPLIPSHHHKFKIHLLEGFALVVFSTISAIWGQMFLLGIAGEVQVTMTFVEWHPGQIGTEIIDENGYLSSSELVQIKSQNLGGQFLTRNQFIVGSGFPIRLVFVISRNSMDSVILPIPRRSAMYFINGRNWSMIPEGVPTFNRTIEMTMPQTYYGGFQIEHANGTFTRASTFIWSDSTR